MKKTVPKSKNISIKDLMAKGKDYYLGKLVSKSENRNTAIKE